MVTHLPNKKYKPTQPWIDNTSCEIKRCQILKRLFTFFNKPKRCRICFYLPYLKSSNGWFSQFSHSCLLFATLHVPQEPKNRHTQQTSHTLYSLLSISSCWSKVLTLKKNQNFFSLQNLQLRFLGSTPNGDTWSQTHNFLFSSNPI